MMGKIVVALVAVSLWTGCTPGWGERVKRAALALCATAVAVDRAGRPAPHDPGAGAGEAPDAHDAGTD